MEDTEVVNVEKVMQGLEACAKDKWSCNECPYFSEQINVKCMSQLGKDAIRLINLLEAQLDDLLREKEAVKPMSISQCVSQLGFAEKKEYRCGL